MDTLLALYNNQPVLLKILIIVATVLSFISMGNVEEVKRVIHLIYKILTTEVKFADPEKIVTKFQKAVTEHPKNWAAKAESYVKSHSVPELVFFGQGLLAIAFVGFVIADYISIANSVEAIGFTLPSLTFLPSFVEENLGNFTIAWIFGGISTLVLAFLVFEELQWPTSQLTEYSKLPDLLKNFFRLISVLLMVSGLLCVIAGGLSRIAVDFDATTLAENSKSFVELMVPFNGVLVSGLIFAEAIKGLIRSIALPLALATLIVLSLLSWFADIVASLGLHSANLFFRVLIALAVTAYFLVFTPFFMVIKFRVNRKPPSHGSKKADDYDEEIVNKWPYE